MSKMKRAHSRSAAVEDFGQRFILNRITATVLMSFGAVPAWAGVNDITQHTGTFGSGVNALTTATTINANGSVTNITTATTRGATAFNSFDHFTVGEGNTVNLVVPDSASNLVNLVHNAQAQVNGTLNGIQGGKIGGNIIFADPQGMVVGAKGVVNVGSLTITTPSTSQMAELDRIAHQGTQTETDQALADLVAGKQKDGSGSLSVAGTVNSAGSINLFAAAGAIQAAGRLNAGANFSSDAADAIFRNTVNIGTAAGTGVARQNGSIEIISDSTVTVSGELSAMMADNSGASVHISAGQSATLAAGTNATNSGRVNTSGYGNKAGGQVKIEAPAITVGSYASINTSTSGSGQAGDITLTAASQVGAHITATTSVTDLVQQVSSQAASTGNASVLIDSNAVLNAGATGATGTGGKITVSAHGSDQQLAGYADASGTITVGGILIGKDIQLDATAEATIDGTLLASLYQQGQLAIDFAKLKADNNWSDAQTYSSIVEALGDAGSLATRAETTADGIAKNFKGLTASDWTELTALVPWITVAIANANASITLNSSAALTATSSIQLTSQATRTVDTSTGSIPKLDAKLPFNFGVAYGRVSGSTTVDVNSAATLSSGTDLALQALSVDTLKLEASATTETGADGKQKAGLAFGMAHSDVTTRAQVADGVNLSVGRDTSVNAITEQSLSNDVTFNADEKSLGGPAIALTLYDSTTQAIFNADLSGGRNLSVTAVNLIDQQKNSATVELAESKETFKDKAVATTQPISAYMVDKLKGLLNISPDPQSTDSGSSGSSGSTGSGSSSDAEAKFAFGSAIAIGLANHTAEAIVGSGSSAPKLSLSGDLSVQALQRENALHNSAQSSVATTTEDSDGASTTLSVAVAYNQLNLTTHALIGDGTEATVGRLGVGAYNEQLLDLGSLDRWSSLADVYSQLKISADDLKTVLTTKKEDLGELPGLLSTNFASGRADGKDSVIVGAVTVSVNSLDASAWVGDNVKLTTTNTTGGDWSSPAVTGLPTLLDEDGNQTTANQAAQSLSFDWHAPLTVQAGTQVQQLQISGNFWPTLLNEAGGDDGKSGGGAVNVQVTHNRSVAGIGAGGAINVAVGAIKVDAQQDELIIGISPAGSKGASAAGSGAVVVSVNNATVAASINTTTSITADAVDLNAEHRVGMWSAAGSIALSQNDGVGASIALNILNSDVNAWVGANRNWRPSSMTGTASTATAAGQWSVDSVNLLAKSDGQAGAFALAGARAKSEAEKQDDDKAKAGEGDASETSDTLASSLGDAVGSSLLNGLSLLSSELKAAKDKADGLKDTVMSAPDTISGYLTKIQAAIKGTTPDQGTQDGSSLAVAGSVGVNVSRQTTRARLGDIVLDPRDPNGTGNDVTIQALNQTNQLAGAGGGALTSAGGKKSESSTAVAGAIAYDYLGNDTEALLENATLNYNHVLAINAITAGDQLAAGLGLAVAAGGVDNSAAALIASAATVTNTTLARVTNSVVKQTTAGLVGVNAYDRSRLLIGGGAFASAKGQGSSVGASLTVGVLANKVQAQWLGSTASGFSSFDLKALSATRVLAGVLSVAASSSDTSQVGAGSIFALVVNNDIRASMDQDAASHASSLTGGTVNVAAHSISNDAALDALIASTGKEQLDVADMDGTSTASGIDGQTTSNDGLTGGSSATTTEHDLYSASTAGEAILGIAGSLAAGNGKAAGGSLGVIYTGSDYTASIANTDLTLTGDLNLAAQNDTQVLAAAIGAAGGKDTAVSGSATAVVGRGQVSANLDMNHHALTARNLSVSATKTAGAYSLAGNIAISTQGTAAGIAVSLSDMAQGASATVSNGSYLLSGNATVAAAEQSKIVTAAMAVAGSGGGTAATGAITYNRISDTTQALLDNVDLHAVDLTVSASQPNLGASIQAIAVNAVGSTSGLGVGGALAVNLIDATRSARLDDSTVNLTGSASLSSSLDGEIWGMGINLAAGTNAGGGSVVVNNIAGGDTVAVDGGSLTTTGSGKALSLDASGGNGLTIGSLAGAITAASGTAVGGAVSVNRISANRTASLSGATVSNFASNSLKSGVDQAIYAVAVAGSGGDVAVAGSSTSNILSGAEKATISGGSVTGGSLSVSSAIGDRTLWSLAGAVAGAASTAVGVANANNIITASREASISGATLALSNGALDVLSGGSATIRSAAAGFGVGGTIAAGASIAVNVISGTETASLDGVGLTGASAVKVDVSRGSADIQTLAGNVQGGGSGAGAGAIAVSTVNQQRTASVNNSSLSLATGNSGIAVAALTAGSIQTMALGGALGGTGAGVFSNTTNIISAATTAKVINSSGTASRLSVSAQDGSNIDSLAGAAALGGTAAVGAAPAVNRIGNDINASLSGNQANSSGWALGDLSVGADSHGSIRTLSISAGAAGTAAISVGLASNQLSTKTSALIDGGAQILAQNNVSVTASDRDTIESAATVAAFSGNAASGGLLTINDIQSSTQAGIAGASTQVTALGNGDGVSVDANTVSGAPDVSAWALAQKFSANQNLAADTEVVHGLAVRATSLQQLGQLSASLTVSVVPIASAAVSGLVNTSVIGGDTSAYIDSAQINASNAGAAAAQQVSVGALNHSYSYGGIASLAASAGVGVAGSVDTGVVSRTVQARLDGANVTSRNATLVRATSVLSAADLVATGGVGLVGVAGSAAVLKLNGITEALVRNGSTLNVGALTVAASAINYLSPNAGTAAAGAAGAGFGINLGYNQSTVRAWVGEVDASKTTRTTVKASGGVNITADSTTTIKANAVTATGGAAAAVAGATNVVLVENTTEAGARNVDFGTSGARADSLNIAATDTLTAGLNVGSAAVGGLAVGGSANVLVTNNATRAQLLDSTAWVTKGFSVNAQRSVDASLTTLNAAGGTATAIGGTIGVLLLGSGGVQAQSSNALDELDKGHNGTLSLADSVGSRSNASSAYKALAYNADGSLKYNADGTLQVAEATEDGTALDASTQNATVTDRFVTTTAYKQETVARVSNSTVDALGAASVSASDKVKTSNIAGGVNVSGVLSAGVAAAMTFSNARVTAELLGGNLAALSLNLNASSGPKDGSTAPAVSVAAYNGAIGGGAGIGAAVAVGELNNTVAANITGNLDLGTYVPEQLASDAVLDSWSDDGLTQLTTAKDAVLAVAAHRINGKLTGQALDSQGLSISAVGAAAGAVGIGAVVGVAQHNSAVSLNVADNVSVASQDIDLSARSQGAVSLTGSAAAGGVLSANAAVLVADADSSATLSIGRAAKLLATGTLALNARVTPQVSASSQGISVGYGISAGGVVVTATSNAKASLTLGDYATLQAQAATLSSEVARNGTQNSLDVQGEGVSGGVGVALNAVVATASNTSTSLLQASDTSRFTGLDGGSGLWSFTASNDIRQHATVNGLAFGSLVLGANVAQASADDSTQALVGGNFSGTFGVLNVKASAQVNNYASASSGQGGLISGSAAVATTRENSTTTARLNARGSDDSSIAHFQAVNLDALHTSTFNAFVNTVTAALVGASGARAQNDVTVTTTAELAAAARLDTYAYGQHARADVIKGASTDDFNVISGSGGLLTGSAAQSLTSVALDTLSRVGDAAYLHLIGDFRVPYDLVISAYNNATLYDRTKLDAGGLINVAYADSKLDLNQSNATVDIGKKADLSSIGDIVLTASGDYLMSASGSAKTYGLATGAGGTSRAKVNAAYDINIQDEATLLGYGDVRLYAGQSNTGNASQATLTARTDLWNNSLFAINSANADAIYQRASQIDVATGAVVNSVGDIYAYADQGWGNLVAKAVAKDLFSQALSAVGIATETDSGHIDNDTKSGVVRVDGTLNSGALNKRWVKITGLQYYVNGVLTDPSAITGNATDVLEIRPIVDKSDDNISYRMVTGTYSQYISARIATLDAQLAIYGVSAKEQAALSAERNLLQITLDKLYTSMGGDTSTGATLARDQQIEIIEIDPILAKPGNVFVTGSALVGNGYLRAPGDSSITVTNDTSAFLRILGLEIPYRDGGQVLFNNASVSDSAAVRAASSGSTVPQNLHFTVSANSADPTITVASTYKSTGAISSGGLTVPVPDIYVQGRIFNQRGAVDITGTGSIYANADIRGKSLSIGTSGNFVLNSDTTFFHLGGDPATNNNGTNLTAAPASSGVVAGDNVVISAQYLNLNGLVQSGVANWTVTIPGDSDLRTLIATALATQTNPSANLAQVVATDFRNGILGYSYDKTTGGLVLDSVTVAGGYMELTGTIMNTGTGNLKVLDGYGQVTVKNNSNSTLSLSSIDLGARTAGTLRLNDVQVNTAGAEEVRTTIYTRQLDPVSGQYQMYQQSGLYSDFSDPAKTVAKVGLGTDRTATYQPLLGLSYTWLTGVDTAVTIVKTYHKDSFWGAFTVGEGDSPDHVTRVDGASRVIDGAEYVSSGSTRASGVIDKTTDPEYKLDKDANGNSTVHTSTESWTSCAHWFLWCQVKRSNLRTTTQTGVRTITRYTVQADNPINISFIGQDVGGLDISSTGNVVLLGSLYNQTGTTSIKTSGSLTQASAGLVTQAKNLTLEAGTGIGTSQQALNVEVGHGTTGSGTIGSLSAKTVTGDLDIAGLNGDLNLAKLETGNGNIDLSAQGNITANAGVVLRGQAITLDASHGSIGSASALLNIDTNSLGLAAASTAKLNAHASQGIFLNETSGDLLLDQAIADGGDVVINVANGDLIDANTTLAYDKRTLDEAKALWNSMDLTGAGAEAARIAQEKVLQQEGQSSYARYWQMRTDANGHILAYDVNQGSLSSSLVAQILAQDPSADIAAMQAQAQKDYATLNERFGATTFSASYVYALSDAQQATLLKTYAWSESQLQNSVGSALLGRGTSTQAKVEDPNIKGHNISLSANRIGKVLADDVIVDLSKGIGNLTEAQLAALAGAEASDVYRVNPNNDLLLRVVQRDDVNVVATGNLTVKANKDVYIGGTNDLNIYNVSGDTVRIKTDGSIESANGSNVVITGHDVVLESSNGNIGGKQAVHVDVSGDLTARANVLNLAQVGDLNILRLTGLTSLTLDVIGNLRASVPGDGSLLTNGKYGENLLGGAINLSVSGSIGSAVNRVQLNSQTNAINLTAGGDAWIGGLGGTQVVNGTLDLNTLKVGGLLDIGDATTVNQHGNWTLGGLAMALDGNWSMDVGTHVHADGDLLATSGDTSTLGDIDAANIDISATALSANATGVTLAATNRLRLRSTTGDLGANTRHLTLSGKALDALAADALYANLAAGFQRGTVQSANVLQLTTLGTSTLDRVQSLNGAMTINGQGLFSVGQALARNNIDVSGSGLSLALRQLTSGQGDVAVNVGGDVRLDATQALAGKLDLSAANAQLGDVQVLGDADINLVHRLSLSSLAADNWQLQAADATVGTAHLRGAVDSDVSGLLQVDTLTGGAHWQLAGGNAKLGRVTLANDLQAQLSGDLQVSDQISATDTTLTLGSGSHINALEVAGDLALKVTGLLDLGRAVVTGKAVLDHLGVAGTALHFGNLTVGDTLAVNGAGDWSGDSAQVAHDASFDVGSANLGSLVSQQGRLLLKARGLFAGTALQSVTQNVDLQSGSARLGSVLANTDFTALTNGELQVTYASAGNDIDLQTVAGSLGDIRVGAYYADPQSGYSLAGDYIKAANNLNVLTDGNFYGGNAEAARQVRVVARNMQFGRVQSRLEDVFLQSTGPIATGEGNIVGLQVAAKQDVGIIANGNLTMPTVTYGGTYSLKAGRDLMVGVGGDLDVTGDASAGRDMTFIIGGKVDLNSLTAGRDILVTSGGAINIAQGVTAGGNIHLAANGGDLTIGTGVISTALAYKGQTLAGNVLLEASGNITTPIVSAAAGAIAVKGNNLRIDDLDAAGRTDLTGAGLIRVNGISRSGGAQQWQAGDSINFGQLLAAGAAQLTAGSDITGSNTSAASIRAQGNSLRLNNLTAVGNTDLFARGLIQVADTSRSGGNQQWTAEQSIDFGHLLAQGQALLDSLLDTRGSVLQADRGAVLNAGWRSNVASNASIRLDQATAPTLSLWAGNLINVADAAIGQSVDLHGQDLAVYGRHTGAGQLDLWVTGSGQAAAQRFDARLDARDIVAPHFYAVDGKLVTTARRVDLQDAAYIDLLDLQTAQAHVVADNLTPQFQRDADVQLYELDKAFALKQEAVTSTTNAYVLHRRSTHQVLIPNFSEVHAPVVTGVMVQGVSAARYGEQQASGRAFGGIIKQLLQSATVMPIPGQWTPPQWRSAPTDVQINLNLDSATRGNDGAKQWDL